MLNEIENYKTLLSNSLSGNDKINVVDSFYYFVESFKMFSKYLINFFTQNSGTILYY